jgi:hypothetical protein
MSSDRRGFFKTAAGAAAALAGLEAGRRAAGTAASVEAAAPPVASGYFALELDGITAGFVASGEGGDASAVVVREAPGETCLSRKHLGPLKFEDISIACGTGMSAAFYEWLQATCRCDAARKSGAIVAGDFNYKEIARRDFKDALITEIGMPKLDASSKDPALMTVKFAPETTQRQKPSGETLKACGSGAAQKKWLAANFRFSVDGLDCKKVNRVEGFTLTQTAAQGEHPRLEVPDLVVTLPEADAESFFAWHEDFVINGNAVERDGTLEYLAPNLGQTLFTIQFENLGIFSLAPEKGQSNSDSIRRVTAEMYCEAIGFGFSRAVVGC